ncbi:uncharacterized protein LACBIDRAFT_305695 [Laccaria bicolor S238N-H82]|uniref:Predicted protein n=1 Tax=Laccaria bicolor (strain S238N-H82 / ATCC MYA-4686) TaxID=486041 RepID=B0CUT9_LACBS|nr:uncharacterized protein LACBIDRAFT_305695 [Laccaria bicolor S238N-H82]EDR14155.1 predicted protein [Laccaria bicolor S238N-H82]|eukprot:XP_001874714.1 predicted protein [Laccaria bicolor S238N-H82]
MLCRRVLTLPIQLSRLYSLQASCQQRARSAPYPKRTHNCGSLTARDAGSRVVLAGWILPERKGKAISFFPIKDSHGTTQLIVNHADNPASSSIISEIPVESTVLIEGTVLLRPSNARRSDPTGEIDVQVDKVTLLNPATNLPFLPSNPHNLPNEDLRSRHRYLDLRRTALSENIKKRSQVAHLVRNILHTIGFTEVETPVLLRSSPEGAREFLVPTRINTASPTSQEPLFYALQQSPQQPKQLLICSGGVDKYFQIAKCFRDEDGRKDRQPEFTQIDLEMAFVSWSGDEKGTSWKIGGGEVRDVIETLLREIWQQFENVALPPRLRVMTYHDAMTHFGSDKPDTRFGLEITDLTDLLPANRALSRENEVIECIVVREPEFIKASHSFKHDYDVEHITLTEENLQTWLLGSDSARQILSQEDQSIVNDALKIKSGDDVWLTRRSRLPKGGSTVLGKVRLGLAELAQSQGEFTPTKDPHFLWITEFPLFTRDDSDKDFLAKGRWSSSHHPFTAPMWEDIPTLYRGDIETVRGQHYDLVLNGVEIGGGSVRIHDPLMQDHIFTNVLQLSENEKTPFNHLVRALHCGAPPHGGIALGFDRIMTMLCNTQSIRDVIAFPKTSLGTDLLFKSPAPVTSQVLYEYGIQPRSAT